MTGRSLSPVPVSRETAFYLQLVLTDNLIVDQYELSPIFKL